MGEREAEVLISVEDVNISECHGNDRVIVAKHVEAMIVSIVPTEEELANASQQMGLEPGTLKADGRPLVFVLAGEYKIPVTPNVPAIQHGAKEFVFTVPNLWMAVTLPEDVDEETAEAFVMLIKTYGKLTAQGGPAPSSAQPASSGYPAGAVAGGYPAGAVAGGGAEAPAQQSRDMPAGYPGPQGGGAYGQQPQGYPVGGGSPVNYPPGAQGGPAGYPAGAVAVQGQHGPPLSTKVAGGVTFLARNLIKGIHKGRDVAVGGIGAGTGKVIQKTKACEEPVHVPPEYRAKMAKARATTKSAVVLTGTVTSALVGISAKLGSGAAGMAGKVIPGSVGRAVAGGPKNKYVEGVKEVGGAVVGGAACVFVEATDAARSVLTAGTEGVSQVAEHKYGSEVGQMTSDGLGAVTDGVQAASNVRNIGIKAVAKNAAKHAGQQLMTDMDNQYGDQPHEQQHIAPPPASHPPQEGGYPQGYPSSQPQSTYQQQPQGYPAPQNYPAPQ